MDWTETVLIYPMGYDITRVIHDDSFKKFYKHLEEGKLPSYTYLVPRTIINLPEGTSREENPWESQPNTQHPSEDIRGGEYLIK